MYQSEAAALPAQEPNKTQGGQTDHHQTPIDQKFVNLAKSRIICVDKILL
jgi:hypothetical protein